MGARLELESPYDTLSLNGVQESGSGVQARTGITGLGLPQKSVQWLEGAGDGAIARGWRVQARDIDLPLEVVGADRDELKYWLARLASILGTNHDHVVHEGVLTLNFYDFDDTKWSTNVEHVGGGDYNYGDDTDGLYTCSLVITLRAGNPYFSDGLDEGCHMYETRSGNYVPGGGGGGYGYS